jgi:hypothetical protein
MSAFFPLRRCKEESLSFKRPTFACKRSQVSLDDMSRLQHTQKMMKNLQLPNNQLTHEQLTSHLGESGIKGRLRSCTRHGTIPEIKTKKDPESNIKHFILFCEKNTRKRMLPITAKIRQFTNAPIR